MPIHLRWELYPVPHESPLHGKHRGSYFESQESWRKPQKKFRGTEWLAMFQEILFMKSLREFNPRLWVPSFLFIPDSTCRSSRSPCCLSRHCLEF